jgi:sigma54-dependent transcription regulator
MQTLQGLAAAGAIFGTIALAAPLGAQEQGNATAGEEVREGYEAVKEYAFARKEEAAAWLNERLRELDASIKALSKRAEEAGSQARAQGEELMDDLEEQRDEASDQLERLQGASADAWEGVKRASIAAFGELEQAIDQVRRLLRVG